MSSDHEGAYLCCACPVHEGGRSNALTVIIKINPAGHRLSRFDRCGKGDIRSELHLQTGGADRQSGGHGSSSSTTAPCASATTPTAATSSAASPTRIATSATQSHA